MKRLNARIRAFSQDRCVGKWGDERRSDIGFLFAYIRNWALLPLWGPLVLIFMALSSVGRRLR